MNSGQTKQTLFCGAGIAAETLQRKSERVLKPAEGPGSSEKLFQQTRKLRPSQAPCSLRSRQGDGPENFPLAVGSNLGS